MKAKSLGRKLWGVTMVSAAVSVPIFAADLMAPCGVAEDEAVVAILHYEAGTVTFVSATAQDESFTDIFTGGSVALGMEHLRLAPNTETHCEFIIERTASGKAEPKAHVRIFKVGKRGTGDATALDIFRPAFAESKGLRLAIEWVKRGPELKSEEKLAEAGGRVAGTRPVRVASTGE